MRLMIKMGIYKTILIDPPWKYGVWGKASIPRSKNHIPKDEPMPYKTMNIEEIKSMDIKSLADENCELYVWVTQKYLPEIFNIINEWGFKYCQTLTWCKNPMGTGQGGVYCPTTEFIILARIGRMPKVVRKNTTWFNIKRTNKHSKKPEFFQDLIETLSDEPRLEIFARRKRIGWDVWGNEVDSDIKIEDSPKP